MATRERLIDCMWHLFWGVASSIWCMGAAAELGASYDEPGYFERGLEHWRTGNCRGLMKLGTMPLPADLATLPLYTYERIRHVHLERDVDLETCLPWSRATTLLFWWLLLGYGWLAGRSLAVPWGGRLAVALLACEPTMLAHSALATSDIAISACLLAMVYHFATSRDAGAFRRIGIPALWFAAAVLSKASGLVFAPLCLVAVELERRRECSSPSFRKFLTDATCIVAGGLLLVILYCGSSTDHAPLPNNAVDGLAFQIKHNLKAGEGTYLLGEYHPPGHAVYYYFPVALTMKLSLPPLLLLVLLLVIRPRSLVNWALAAAGALLLFSLTCRVQIGIRYMLPLIALGTVGLAAAVVQTWQSISPGWPRRLLAATAGVGVAWSAAAAIIVWPNGLCYTNELWGGTARGYLCLSDSNYDWGQGLKELARWHERNSAPLDVCYFGSDPAIHKLCVRALTLEKLPLHGPDGMLEQVRGHFLAVSTTALYGHPASTTECAAFLRGRQPVDRTSTFMIYDFTREPEEVGQATRLPP